MNPATSFQPLPDRVLHYPPTSMKAKACLGDILSTWKIKKKSKGDPYAGLNKNFCMLHQFKDVIDAGFVEGELVVVERRGGLVREREVSREECANEERND